MTVGQLRRVLAQIANDEDPVVFRSGRKDHDIDSAVCETRIIHEPDGDDACRLIVLRPAPRKKP